jgi:predicted dehydrogenase
MSEPAPLRVGVVGVGHLGSRHAEIYARLPGVRLVGVADLLADRAAAVAERTGADPLGEAGALLGRVDAVSIAVPTESHHTVGLEFLRRGIPALIEKPLAQTIPQAEELVRAARRAGTLLQVGHVERFNPAVAAVKEPLGEPRFIECHRLGPFSFRSTDIDVVLDLMIHDIDIVLHLVHAPLKRVDAVGVSLLLGGEDLANARLEFDNGTVANVTASRISDKAMRKIRAFSEDTYVSLDLIERSARIYKASPQLKQALRGLAAAGAPPTPGALPEQFYEVRELRYQETQPLEEQLKAFVECVRHKREPLVPGEHGLRAMSVAERILQEVREHTWK